MLDFLVFCATTVVFYFIVKRPLSYILSRIDEKQDGPIAEISAVIVIIITLVLFVAFYGYTGYQVTLPHLTGDDYVATYRDGHVVKLPYGGVEYIQGDLFRVSLKESEHLVQGDTHYGDTIIIDLPAIRLDQLQYSLKIIDADLFFNEPRTRSSKPFCFYEKWLDKRIRELQLEYLKPLLTSGDLTAFGNENCKETGEQYFRNIQQTIDKEARLKGFSVTEVRQVYNNYCRK